MEARPYVVGIVSGETGRGWEGAGPGGRAVRNARAPTGLQWCGAYFLASAMFAAARYRRFTSGQLMLRMKASR
jgi:hypothetical protein